MPDPCGDRHAARPPGIHVNKRVHSGWTRRARADVICLASLFGVVTGFGAGAASASSAGPKSLPLSSFTNTLSIMKTQLVIAAVTNGLGPLNISTAGTEMPTALVLLAAVPVDSVVRRRGAAKR